MARMRHGVAIGPDAFESDLNPIPPLLDEVYPRIHSETYTHYVSIGKGKRMNLQFYICTRLFAYALAGVGQCLKELDALFLCQELASSGRVLFFETVPQFHEALLPRACCDWVNFDNPHLLIHQLR